MPNNLIPKFLLIIFLLLCGLNLFAEYTINHTLIYFSKPLLVTSLAAYFWVSTKNKPQLFKTLLLLGLLFSIFGDTILMFVEKNPGKPYLFLLGLSSFLITHLFYISAFLKFPSDQDNWLKSNPLMVLPFLFLLIGMLYYLWPGLGDAMKIPVSVYSAVIIGMALAALTMKNKIAPKHFNILIAGVILFIISDSLIAFNKFKSFQPLGLNPRLSIMLTYMTAQFLIVIACTRIIKAAK